MAFWVLLKVAKPNGNAAHDGRYAAEAVQALSKDVAKAEEARNKKISDLEKRVMTLEKATTIDLNGLREKLSRL